MNCREWILELQGHHDMTHRTSPPRPSQAKLPGWCATYFQLRIFFCLDSLWILLGQPFMVTTLLERWLIVFGQFSIWYVFIWMFLQTEFVPNSWARFFFSWVYIGKVIYWNIIYIIFIYIWYLLFLIFAFIRRFWSLSSRKQWYSTNLPEAPVVAFFILVVKDLHSCEEMSC